MMAADAFAAEADGAWRAMRNLVIAGEEAGWDTDPVQKPILDAARKALADLALVLDIDPEAGEAA